MRKDNIDKIVNDLIKSGWRGKTHSDFKEKLGEEYSYDQIERIRVRYNYILTIDISKNKW